MVSYRPLFITLAEKELSVNSLYENKIISSATQAKFRKNKSMGIDLIAKVCKYLDVPIEKVVEII